MAPILLAPPFWVAVGQAVSAAGAAIVSAAPWIVGGAAVVGGGAIIANQMSKAEEEAKAREQAGTKTIACATCKDNPCAHLAAGMGGPYRGGAHGAMALPVNDNLDSHHAPADAISPLPRPVGPSIQMDPADHRRTASFGRGPDAIAYRAAQKAMIESGNFLGAVAMDVADVRSKFGDKYDSAIMQMEAYAACLKRNGIVQ